MASRTLEIRLTNVLKPLREPLPTPPFINQLPPILIPIDWLIRKIFLTDIDTELYTEFYTELYTESVDMEYIGAEP